MNLRETPGTVPESNRHRRPWKDGSRTSLVELVDPIRGTLRQAKFKVPVRLVKAIPHTNDGIEFEQYVYKAINRWKTWLMMEGWVMMGGRPKVLGPFDIPTSRPGEPVDPDFKEYHVRHFFHRDYPLYMKLDDALEINRLADVHDIDLNKAWRPWAGSPNAKKNPDSDWVDPLKYAEERRQRKGIKRKDYLMDSSKELTSLEKPLKHVHSPEIEKALKRRRI